MRGRAEAGSREAARPVYAVLGGISATSRVSPGWWESQVGPGRAIDTDSCRVIGFDWIVRPEGPTTTADQADALANSLAEEGIGTLDAIVGASYGGMVALAFAERHPARVRRLVILSAAHRSHAMATAHRAIQRRIIALGSGNGHSRDALALARALAITTYRTAAGLADRFDPAADGADDAWASQGSFEVESWLTRHGDRFAEAWTAERYLALSLSLDLHRVDPARIAVPVALLAVDGDTLVPPSQMEALRSRLRGGATLTTIQSRFGHDAFLKEPRAVADFLRASLGSGGRASAATVAVRAGIGTDRHHRAVVPPIHLSSTFEFDGFDRKGRYDYTRSGNPTRDHLAAALAELEGGAGCCVTSTGMSAVSLALQLLGPGERVLAPHDCYGGTWRLLGALARRGQIALATADLTGPDAEACVRASGARMLWIETPSNPLLRITDIARLASAAREMGALVVVDNTFLSPALQRPLELGADLVVHSTTKYLNGHSDVVGGAVVARDPAVHEELAWWANCVGISGSPFDSFLTLRGLRTLHPRIRAHGENAARLAALLEHHPAVERVHYPGLAAHPGHAIAARQQSGFGAMISFELAGGVPAVRRFVGRLRHFSLAESLGGVESLVAHPATMTHAAMDAAARARAGISDALVRISVGIEAGEDLERDLGEALG